MLNVTCAIIYFGNQILVTQRSEKMKLALKWEFPGGKVEPNESSIDCIKREIKEEINIKIEILGKLTDTYYDYKTFQINLIPYLAKYVSGTIQLSEHSAYKLLAKDQLLNLDWAEADLPIVHEILNTKI